MNGTTIDRRTARTRASVMDAFRELVFDRGYDDVGVREIAQRANVGRSTFYEHFDDKADVLRQSIVLVLEPIAEALTQPQTDPRLDRVLEHVWQSRRLSRSLLAGQTRGLCAHILADLIHERLAQHVAASRNLASLIPLPLIATQLADAQIGLIAAWLLGKAPCAPHDMARAIVSGGRATIGALIRTGGR